MGKCKIVYNDEVLIDLSQDSVTPETLDEGVTAHDKDGNPIVGTRHPATEPVLQEKMVTPTETAQSVEPDDGYDGLSKVEVGAIPSGYVRPTGTLAITENRTTADVSEYKSVKVNIPTGPMDITANGIYIASVSGLEGFTSVAVSVPSASLVSIEAGPSVEGYGLYFISERCRKEPLRAYSIAGAAGGIVIQSSTEILPTSGLLFTGIVGSCRVYYFEEGGSIGW